MYNYTSWAKEREKWSQRKNSMKKKSSIERRDIDESAGPHYFSGSKMERAPIRVDGSVNCSSSVGAARLRCVRRGGLGCGGLLGGRVGGWRRRLGLVGGGLLLCDDVARLSEGRHRDGGQEEGDDEEGSASHLVGLFGGGSGELLLQVCVGDGCVAGCVVSACYGSSEF